MPLYTSTSARPASPNPQQYSGRQPVIIPGNSRRKTKKKARTKRTSPLSIILWMSTLVALLILFITLHAISGNAITVATTCHSLIRTTDYTKYIQLQANTQQMGAIQDVEQLDGGQPAALVPVIGTTTQQTLDVYIYGCTTQQHTPSLTLLFKQQGLTQGTVSISQSNTLVLSEHDTTLSQETTAVLQPMQQSIYQEYRWQQGAFVRVLFPGLYPVTSRSEAEALQQQTNNGQSLPWTDPQKTAEQMAKDLFQWQDIDTSDTVLDNDGTTAHVLLVQPHLQVTVALSRLVQHDSHGLWFVTQALSSGIALKTLPIPVTSPITLQGSVTTSDGNATATLFDHTLTRVNSLNTSTLIVQADGTYNGSLYYTNVQPNQQGVLLIENTPADGSSEQTQLLLISVVIG